MLRYGLLPFVLIVAILFMMAAWIMATTLHHRLAWPETSALVIKTGQALTGNRKFGKPVDLTVTVRYDVAGNAMTWTGFAKDIGVYAARVGDRLTLHFDPNDPTRLDTAAMKGWRGGVLVLAITGGIVFLYTWFFWLRGGRPPAAPSRPAARPRRAGEFGLR
jgi:hypothetical protein